MADANIPVSGTNNRLQTYRNTKNGAVVDSEAVTPTDENGNPFTASNPFPVSASLNLSDNADVFGNLIVGSKNNQVEVHFDDTNYTTYTTNTLGIGASATQSAGSVTYSSGTDTNGRAQTLSVDSTTYRAFHEIYWAWTACWPDGGLANAYQRIGAGDAAFVDGVQATFEGTSFGLIYFNNSASTFAPQASWSIDKCDGSSGSAYTLDGVPVAMDTTKKQVFVARAGLLGSHTLEVWVSNPDRELIPVHVFSHANLNATAIFSNFDLPMLLDIKKTGAGASSVSIRTACWAGGVTSYLQRLTDTISDRTLAQTVRAVLTGRSTAGGTSYVNVKVNPSGSVQVGGEVNVGALASVTGSTPYSNTALSNTKQTVKSSSGRLYGYHLFNPNTSSIFVQFFDALAASVIVGTTTPTFVLTIPANATSPATLDTQLTVPISFGTGIVVAATTTATGSTAPTTPLNCSLFYA